MNSMQYTIKQLADLAGVTTRTLHYYDEIGLLSPAYVAENSYRCYEEKQLLQLQQILFFRELEFSLDEIKTMLSNPGFDMLEALTDQKQMMQLKRSRIDELIQSIDNTITHMKQDTIKSEELYDAFKDDDIKEYQEEAKRKWGNTDPYKQSMQRVNKMSKQQMEQLKEDGKKFTQELADSMAYPIDSPQVQQLIQKHYEGIQFFYDCSLDMYRNLGKMYVDDPRFTAYYDKFRPGLAQFVRDAIAVYCDNNSK